MSALTIHRITWTVRSASEPKMLYAVSAASPDDVLRCTCKAEQYPKTRGRCWHIKAVRAGMAGKPRVRVSVAPERKAA